MAHRVVYGITGKSFQVLRSSKEDSTPDGSGWIAPALVTTPRFFGGVEHPAMNNNVSVAAMEAICLLFFIRCDLADLPNDAPQEPRAVDPQHGI